ncbi:MAG: Nif11-like leader peptide family natural product precursor [Stigonema ocellatum SAG 48.90 = DSM 106950]|nr:Nif11-like leader peptide family natural product precursor [Stigonema ocellatum SAG 48.90 = DSM 106950]
MSKQAVREFYKVFQSDEALEERIKSTDSTASVIKIAAEKGYEFTELELEAFMQESVASGELSEEELEVVAGGNRDGDKTKISIRQE